jgi:hypothetical protein
MKRNVLVIAGLAVLSTNAFASKARVEALNQDSVRGSEYISDSRNIFRNPAHLNTMSNYLITEWGTTTAADDSQTAPRAEGGFFREMGSFNYGLYLGNNETVGTTSTGFLRQDNALDLFFAGDMGLQWGAKVHYAGSKDETVVGNTRKNSAIGLGLGIASGAFDAYADVTIADKSEGRTGGLASDELKTKPSYLVGGSYTWNSTTFFANYEATKADQKLANVSTTVKSNAIVVGAGRTWDINPTAKVFTDAKVVLESSQTPTPKLKSQTLPLTIGMEAEATSWLTLRGAVSQNFILNNEEVAVAGVAKKRTVPNSTNVSAGATLNFGKLKVDGVIGNTGASRATGTTGQEQGVLTTDNLLTRVGVTYMF